MLSTAALKSTYCLFPSSNSSGTGAKPETDSSKELWTGKMQQKVPDNVLNPLFLEQQVKGVYIDISLGLHHSCC